MLQLRKVLRFHSKYCWRFLKFDVSPRQNLKSKQIQNSSDINYENLYQNLKNIISKEKISKKEQQLFLDVYSIW